LQKQEARGFLLPIPYDTPIKRKKQREKSRREGEQAAMLKLSGGRPVEVRLVRLAP